MTENATQINPPKPNAGVEALTNILKGAQGNQKPTLALQMLAFVDKEMQRTHETIRAFLSAHNNQELLASQSEYLDELRQGFDVVMEFLTEYLSNGNQSK